MESPTGRVEEKSGGKPRLIDGQIKRDDVYQYLGKVVMVTNNCILNRMGNLRKGIYVHAQITAVACFITQTVVNAAISSNRSYTVSQLLVSPKALPRQCVKTFYPSFAPKSVLKQNANAVALEPPNPDPTYPFHFAYRSSVAFRPGQPSSAAGAWHGSLLGPVAAPPVGTSVSTIYQPLLESFHWSTAAAKAASADCKAV